MFDLTVFQMWESKVRSILEHLVLYLYNPHILDLQRALWTVELFPDHARVGVLGLRVHRQVLKYGVVAGGAEAVETGKAVFGRFKKHDQKGGH